MLQLPFATTSGQPRVKLNFSFTSFHEHDFNVAPFLSHFVGKKSCNKVDSPEGRADHCQVTAPSKLVNKCSMSRAITFPCNIYEDHNCASFLSSCFVVNDLRDMKEALPFYLSSTQSKSIIPRKIVHAIICSMGISIANLIEQSMAISS